MFAVFQSARKGLRGAVFGLSALVLAACEPIALNGTGPTINTQAPVPVALLVPGGSDQASDSVLAQSLENAARLAISDLEGVEIDLRVYNTGGSSDVAAAQAELAVADGAKIILGPVYSTAANAAGVAVANNNVNVLSFSNNAKIAGGNVFVLGHTFQNTADRLVSFSKAQGRERILVVHDGDESGQAGRDAIVRAAANSGATITETVGYELTQQGVVDAVSIVRGAAREQNAQSVFFTANTAGALPLLTQMLPESGLDVTEHQFIGLTRWDIPVQTLSLPGVQGGWFALPDPGLTSAFRSRYEAAYGASPHPIGGLAYDGIAAIGALVKAGQSDALTVSALTQGAGFQGVNGVFRLRSDGTNERGLAVATIRDKQVVVIDPAPRSFGAAGF